MVWIVSRAARKRGLIGIWGKKFFCSTTNHETLEKVKDLIREAGKGKILVMAGAGLSTPSGIPDFRSPTSGIYDNLAKYDLPYPEAIFDIEYFQTNPKPFNIWSKEFLPGVNYKPSVGHFFVKLLQDKQLLLRHYTQNIDGLEVLAGIEEDRIVAAHGSFSKASCIFCKKAKAMDEVKEIVLNDGIPYCECCGGLVKPNIVFFGEMLPERFHELSHADTADSELLLCVGTSLEVYPFAGVADAVPFDVPRVLINRDLVGSFGSRDKDLFLSGDLVDSLNSLIVGLNWVKEFETYMK